MEGGITLWGVLSAGFAAVGAGIGHLHFRVNRIDENAHDRAIAGDDKLWAAIEGSRKESREAHVGLLAEVQGLRAGIDDDRRAHVDQLMRSNDRLLAEIRQVAGKG